MIYGTVFLLVSQLLGPSSGHFLSLFAHFHTIQYGYVGRWLNSGRKTVGALDLGGASTQITFETPETVENELNSMTLRLYGQEYSLYTHSYLCYGKEEALRQILAYLVEV